MEYTTLGNTDIQISKLCVGCMSFGKAGTMHDWTLDETETEKVVKHALSLEINFFDTANGYSAGTSEEYLGRALKKNVARDKVVIASKVYFNPGRLSAGAIHREIDGTLKRLGTDYLDLYIIHRFDYDVHRRHHGGSDRSGEGRQGAGAGCLCHVRLPVLQYAACRP